MEKAWFQKLKKTDKLLLLLAAGILLVVLSWPGKKEVVTSEKLTMESSEDVLSYEKKQEQRLSEILSQMEGVGRAEVMITYKSSEERIVREDSSSSRKSVEETDSGGGMRTQEEVSLNVDTLTTGGEGEPYVVKELVPEVEGILVLADGGDKASVKAQIIEAVQALFPLESHKIKVLKRGS